jgi:hypothetical protein
VNDRNGESSDTVTLPRQLMQAILDAIGTLPAGQVYPLLRRIDDELGLSAPVTADAQSKE